MMLDPQLQERVYQEVHKVVGEDRLPNQDDISQMPLMNAVVKEILRWRPPVPMGMFVVFRGAYMGVLLNVDLVCE